MLEEVKRFGTYKAVGVQRDVAPVNPYPRINPQQERQEGQRQQEPEKGPAEQRARRRFTAMRDLINELKNRTLISHVDFNTANRELIEQGLAIAEEDLLAQLLHLKVPLGSIEELSQQIREQRGNPMLVSGRTIKPDTTLFPVFVEDLSEYLLRFEGLRVTLGDQHNDIYELINNNGRFVFEHDRLRLSFTRGSVLPAAPGSSLNLNISIQVGAVEVDENGRRAILYQRPDQNFALYSDKLLNLSI